MFRPLRPALPFLALLAAALTAGHADAQLIPDQAVVELSSAAPQRVLTLTNDGADRLYVNLELARVPEPALAPRRLEPSVDPLADRVLVHPRQLVIEPGRSRTVRIMIAQDGQGIPEERVMRLVLTPLAGDALFDPRADRAGVRMLLGYRLPVFVRPDRLAPRVVIDRGDDALHLVNRGNTNVMLQQIRVCDQGGTGCRDLTPDRLYVGERLALALPAGTDAAGAQVFTRQNVSSDVRDVAYEP